MTESGSDGAHRPDRGPDQVSLDAERIEAEVLGLDDSTDPFVNAVRATRMPMIITNPRRPDNPVVFANESFCRLTGYAREEILGRNCRFLQGPETDPESVSRIRAAVEAVRPIEIDIRNHRKDGVPFWNRLLMAPVFDGNGVLAYFFASQVDVTIERERLAGLQTDKAALKAELDARERVDHERDRELDLAMRAGGLGAWSVDVRTRTLIASDAYKTLMGWPVETPFTYEDRQKMIHPDDRDAVRAQSDATIRGEADYHITHRIITPVGGVRWMEARGILVSDADGTPLRISGVTTDITDRVRSERLSSAMVELSDVLRDLDDPEDITYAAAEILGRTLEVSRAGFGIVDQDGETITIARDWNAPGVETIAGVLNFRDYGSYVEDLKRGETVAFADAREDPRTRENADVLEALTARAVVNMPLTEQGGMVALAYLNHASVRAWQEDEIRFLRDVGERTLAARERRRAERHLAKLAASLERTVEQRTAELMASEAALRQSQKMEAVGQLTGGIAHDFNNLLTGVTGSLEIVAKRLAEGRASEVGRFITAAQAAAQRATALTHRLLAFSRRQTLEPKATDVETLARGMEDLIRQTMGPAIRLETRYQAGTWPVLVDPGQLENALLNLCINARDAMPDGGRLTVETDNVVLDRAEASDLGLPGGDYVRLSVADTGVGMNEEVIARAFDPFFTTKPLGQGTGLGLSMIYGFVQQSGGQVRIQSTPGAGAAIGLYLPRHHGPVEVGQVVDEPAPSGAPRRRYTVLIVDDEATIRMLVSEGLSELGYDFIEAEDGRAGLAVLRSGRSIDLLITDVGLPGGMNGRQLADAARVRQPGLKVLFITGYAETSVLSGGDLEAGMRILTKPFELKQLAQRVEAILSED
ncbi:MAG: PAS domain-containing protein [Brevundimonas sp.]|uniref:PAS domain-containing protein n=1 Tax=Brevundimonas sp. TaxID=1871086 RepID=UPI00271FADCE|nr:PAS domain-containing protein [Brevundimonas sp.]MDO9609990.1 PAS domain-containing protein [Brevundimonas sp.]